MATHEIRSVELSSYLDYLPAIYREDLSADSTNFLGRFLLAFERILTGVGDPDDPGFEEITDGIPKPDGTGWRLAGLHRYFDPGYYFDPIPVTTSILRSRRWSRSQRTSAHPPSFSTGWPDGSP